MLLRGVRQAEARMISARTRAALIAKTFKTEVRYTVWYGMLRCGCVVVWCRMVWYGMVWYGMAWHGMVWYGVGWYGLV